MKNYSHAKFATKISYVWKATLMQNLQPRFHKNEKLLQVALGSQMNYHMLIILQSFFAGSNEFPRKNNNGQAEKRRLPLADIGNISPKKNSKSNCCF